MRKKKSIIFLIVLFLSNITSQAYSLDICEEGRKGLTNTNVVYSEYFNSHIKGNNAAGYAKVRDVYPTRSGNQYFLKLDCGNDVILLTKSDSAFLKDLKIGQQVSFSGEVKSWNKPFYRDSDKYYIEIYIHDSSISY